MDIKQRLERMVKAAYGLEGLSVVPDTLAAVCGDARAEIERLEKLIADADIERVTFKANPQDLG